MIIESSAPTRADLAGGTIDIWPLYLFHTGASTVNFALSLRARVRIETRADDRIILESRDRGVRFETTIDRIDELTSDKRLELVSKMVHFFLPETGLPRMSGINNWEMFKRHINGDAEVFEIFERIRDAAEQMRDALLASDWDAVREIMRAAYPNRKRLAPNITTPHMDAIVEKALANGAEAAKVCGAGGGGCIAFLCTEGRKQEVERALAGEAGAEILNWKVSSEGLLVSEA